VIPKTEPYSNRKVNHIYQSQRNKIQETRDKRRYYLLMLVSEIFVGEDIECFNGIKDTICWNGRNNNNAPVAPAWYKIEFNVTNDCGTFNEDHCLLHTQGTNFISKTPYLCNNSVYLPIECCGHEPDVYIYDEVFTGAGYADLIAMNSITAEDITVETSVDLFHFQAGDYIDITDAIIEGDFIAEIKPCEPLYNRAYFTITNFLKMLKTFLLDTLFWTGISKVLNTPSFKLKTKTKST